MALINVNGVDINYIDSGSGTPVVLLHGLGSSNRDWDLQIPVLAQKFRVIAPDLRAHGHSTRVPEKQGVEYMMEDIFQLLKKTGISKANMVGFSMGGAVSFELAYQHPEIVDKMIIINSSPDFNNSNSTGIDLLAERTEVIKTKGFHALAEKIATGMFPEEHQKTWRESFQKRVVSNDEDAYLLTFGELMKWGLGTRLKEISHKTLIITSDHDYTSVEYKRSYQEKMKNAALVVINNSRHGVVLDGAEQLNREILNFLLNG
ncbi:MULTISPECIES: alpha/beta hydrolase [unclassified Chryseobacterium]|uniref:alpha/beta fold hydrolase n=1 Tax=unclassified Chryseobacterium TaxID=2593645 RepID=UPI000F4F2987|nr:MULTISPECIES: alpha/beta hydrolase [unclassified Chryseobacterium]